MTEKVTVTREWNAIRVRRMCIDHDYYTRGDNEDYSHMLNWVDRLYPNVENMLFIAKDIKAHSDEDIPVESIMFGLEREAVVVHFDIEY